MTLGLIEKLNEYIIYFSRDTLYSPYYLSTALEDLLDPLFVFNSMLVLLGVLCVRACVR